MMSTTRQLIGLAAGAALALAANVHAEGPQIQRSIIIEPYPQEKIKALEKNIATVSGPAQELVVAMGQLEEARKGDKENSTPASRAQLNKATAVAVDRLSKFVDSARTTKTPLTLGFSDLADYLDVNAASMKQHVKQTPGLKRTTEYMQKQSKAIRQFSKDFDEMVVQLEKCSSDLSARASGWLASSRIVGMMQDVYGPGGTEGVYNTMSQVVQSMSTLKSLFSTDALIEGPFDSEKKEADMNRAKENYQKALEDYYQK